MDRNPPDNARDMGSDPQLGEVPHVMEKLSPCATTTELVLWSPQVTTTEPKCHKY